MNVPETGLTIDARVVRVIDGDTVVVETTLQHTVRLLDCWAPETRTRDLEEKAKGLKAKKHVQELLDACGNKVRLHVPGHDGQLSKLTTIGRVLGRLWRLTSGGPEAQDVSALMVQAGHATPEKVRA